MKYIISESKLNKVIDAYLDSQLEPHKIVRIKNYDDEPKIYWVVNDKVVGEFSGPFFWIHERIFKSLMGLVSMRFVQIKKELKRYLDEHHNIKNVHVNYYDFDSSNDQELYDELRQN